MQTCFRNINNNINNNMNILNTLETLAENIRVQVTETGVALYRPA